MTRRVSPWMIAEAHIALLPTPSQRFLTTGQKSTPYDSVLMRVVLVTKKSTSRKQERKARLRSEILEAASMLFAAKGYETVTLRAIAEEIGYSHATIYQYFPDKSRLLAEICQETFGLLVEDFDRVAGQCAQPKERLFEVSRGLVRFCLSHPQHVRIVFFGPEDRNGIRAGEYIGEIGQPLFERFTAVFLTCLTQSKIKVANPLLAAHAWWCGILGIALVLIIQGDLPGFSSREDIVEQIIETFWSGLSMPRTRVVPGRTSAKLKLGKH